MRVFVTGASGWIGRGLVPELTAAGHEVTGLARSHASAKALQAAEATVRLGSLDDLATLRDAAAASDGVIHLAFKHDIAFAGDFAGATAADRAAIGTFGEALAGTGKPFVIASGILGVLGLPPGAVATEHDGLAVAAADRAVPISGAGGRMANAHYTRALAGHGVRSSIVRLPPATHGNGDNGFIPAAIGFAREKGATAYVGDGANRALGPSRRRRAPVPPRAGVRAGRVGAARGRRRRRPDPRGHRHPRRTSRHSRHLRHP